jgi:hypothetical protein
VCAGVAVHDSGLVFSSMLFYCMALFDYFDFHIDTLRAEAGE